MNGLNNLQNKFENIFHDVRLKEKCKTSSVANLINVLFYKHPSLPKIPIRIAFINGSVMTNIQKLK